MLHVSRTPVATVVATFCLLAAGPWLFSALLVVPVAPLDP